VTTADDVPAPLSRGRRVRELAIGFAWLMAFLWLGEGIAHGLGLPVPGNVIGMVLLTTAILSGLVRLAWVARCADLLLSRLGLFFVPPGVGVMLYWDLIGREWLALTGALLGSALVVLLATGWLAARLERPATGDTAS